MWVEPRWVAQVRFKTWTGDGMLRHAVFERLREDKRIEECLLPAAPEVPAEEPHPPAPAAATAAPERTLKFTNLDKVFWPEERYTKRDLIEYYRTISPWLLPYLRERPVVLTRYPEPELKTACERVTVVVRGPKPSAAFSAKPKPHPR